MNLNFDISLFLRDSLLVMLAWFFMAASFFIWGRFFSSLLKIKISGHKGIIANIWLGFAFCIFFFSLYHLFFPINAFASCLFYFPGIIYFVIKYSNKLSAFFKTIGNLKITIILLTLFAASAIAIQAPTSFDAGLYHLNSIRWNNEYHIVKGIGNLHTRLGFNQTFFLYCASLNFHPFLNDYGFHVSNSFLYALFFVGIILSGTITDLLLVALFFFIPMPYHWLTSPTPDLASTLIQLFSFRYFVEAVYFNYKNKERIGFISLAAILSAVLITIKLTNIVYAAGLGFVTIMFYKKYNFEVFEKKQLTKAFVFIGIFFGIWLIRGYIQTGYPAFPSSIGGINFEWTVPQMIAKRMENNVYAGSRSCETTFDIDSPILKNYAWLPLWLKRNIYDSEIYWAEDSIENIYVFFSLLFFPSTVNNWGIGSVTLLTLSIIFLLISVVAMKRDTYFFNKCSMLFYLLLVEIITIAFWFFMAPCPRFANGIFIIFFITSVLLIKTMYSQLKVNKYIKIFLSFYAFILFIWNFSLAYSNGEFAIGGIKPVIVTPMREFVSKSGLKVLIPQKGIVQCWDSPIPSTIEPKLDLSLIGSKIENGFCLKLK